MDVFLERYLFLCSRNNIFTDIFTLITEMIICQRSQIPQISTVFKRAHVSNVVT